MKHKLESTPFLGGPTQHGLVSLSYQPGMMEASQVWAQRPIEIRTPVHGGERWEQERGEIFHAFVESWDSVPQGSTAQMSKATREKGCSFHVQTEITLKFSVSRVSQTVCMVRAY